MIRTIYIYLISFALIFLFLTNAANLAANGIEANAGATGAVKSGALCPAPDGSPFLFAYWDMPDSATALRDQNRQLSARVSVNLLRYLPLTSSKLIAPDSIGVLYAEFSPPVSENYLVTLRKFRI